MQKRLFANWVYGGGLAALLLLLLTPVMSLSGAALAAFLALPVYMIHQYEEHDADRFRIYINALLGPDQRGLSVADVFLINIVGVWAVLVVVLWATVFLDPGWAAIAGWLLAFNGVVHILPALVLRRYNPGLYTALALFLPLSVWVFATAKASLAQQVIAALFIVGLHAAILLRARQSVEANA